MRAAVGLVALACTVGAQDRVPPAPLPRLDAHAARLAAYQRGPYERTVDFAARVGKVAGVRRVLWAPIAFKDACTTIEYDADRGLWRVQLERESAASVAGLALPSEVATSLTCTATPAGSYIGTNGFGVKTTVRRARIRGAGIVGAFSLATAPAFEVPMSRDSARALRGQLAFLARVVADTADGGAYLGTADVAAEATLDSPIELVGRKDFVTAREAEILLVHMPSRRVLWRAPLVQPLEP